jgi:hypothetical protein
VETLYYVLPLAANNPSAIKATLCPLVIKYPCDEWILAESPLRGAIDP